MNMSKIEVTAQQRANAVEALHVMWPSIPSKNVFPRLMDWRDDRAEFPPTCGTVACFGGWSEWYPPFKAQLDAMGFSPGNNWDGVCRLFGDMHIPEGRENHPADRDFEGTDHELVTNRLNWLIENSEVVA
jgi:hypothetical protein